MPNWKKVIVSGSDAVLNSLNVTTALTAGGLNYPTADGTANQVIQTDGLGNLSFGSVDTTYEVVKNVAGTTLYKGTPVHATASNALGNVIGIIAASASNPATMPATFILNEDLADEAEGYAIISGLVQGVDTSAFEEGDVVYVGENSGYTNVKPTGSNLIQNLGIVTKIHPSNGAGIVLGAGRSNDVPNLLSGEVFWGEGNRAIKKPLAHILSGSSYTYSGSFSGSFQGDGSGLTGIVHYTDADTLSYINTLGVVSSSAQLSNATIPGNLTIEGKLTAQEFHTEFVSASIIYESGSTKFGDTLDDTHTFIGSLDVSGSVSIDGKIALNDGGNSVYIGDDAGRVDDGSDRRNVGIGYRVLYFNTTGNSNVANGYYALYSNTSGNQNTANGYGALFYNTSGNRNVANGVQALFYNTSGYNNTANGFYALYNNTTGYRNTANGYEALGSNTTGGNNTANGTQALYSNTTGGGNVANGYEALRSNTTGIQNTANGTYALYSNTTGGSNVANGFQALYSLATGSNNTAEGTNAGRYQVGTTDPLTEIDNSVFIGYNTKGTLSATNENVFGYEAEGNGSNSVTLGNTSVTKTIINGNLGLGTTSPTSKLDVSGSIAVDGKIALNDGGNSVYIGDDAGLNDDKSDNRNVGVGHQALYSNTTGASNIANGYQALYSNTSGENNVANGRGALYSNTTGINNVANGRNALYSNTSGNNNTSNGYRALYSNTTGANNTANGYQALRFNTTGAANVANGLQALRFNTTGIYNTANGTFALYSNTTGNQNTANGYQALYSNTTGNYNIANGYGALFSNTTGNSNVANGLQALRSNTTGINNTANGTQALYSNTTGAGNIANGYQALYTNTTGGGNIANGTYALYSNASGNYNIANGFQALTSLATGSNNIAEGTNAGRYQVGTTNPLTEVDNSVFIGTNTKGTLSATNENVFGYGAEGNGSNSVTIGNTSVTKTIINGNLGLGTTSPSHKLDIAGDVRILSSSLSYQENIDVDSAATEVVATVSISDYDAAFFDYVIKSGTNLRAGTVTAVHNGTSVEYNEVSTQDLGTTSDVTLSVDISGTDLRLLATTTTDNWTVKSLVKTL